MTKTKNDPQNDIKEGKLEEQADEKVCGIVMPIAAMGKYSETHWLEVRQIISDAIKDAGFKPNLVSDSEDVGVIQKRIVQNLYDNEIVVCDVSGKNPNVMFELGLRLAFDKPTIIVTDNDTGFSFDTNIIEHIIYRSDLRYTSILDFKVRLTDKIKATIKASKASDYTTFLKHFGEFNASKLTKKEGSLNEIILDEIASLNSKITNLSQNFSRIIRQQEISTTRNHTIESLSDYYKFNSPEESEKLRKQSLDTLNKLQELRELKKI